jgi:flavin reductase (DIM6/NTAB) family NADH-FMN oxidoreductase RutF
MERKNIDPLKLSLAAFKVWKKDWFLLTGGDFAAGKFNTMTVAWGSIGNMWDRPFVLAVVRPTRYTYGFMEQYPTFTLSLLPDRYRQALNFCGTKSGRDVDKVAATGLTPIAGRSVAAPAFDEAELIIECRQIYVDDYAPEKFLDPKIDDNYRLKDYHRLYYGQIEAIQGIDAYSLA